MYIAPGPQGTLTKAEIAQFKRDGFFIRRNILVRALTCANSTSPLLVQMIALTHSQSGCGVKNIAGIGPGALRGGKRPSMEPE